MKQGVAQSAGREAVASAMPQSAASHDAPDPLRSSPAMLAQRKRIGLLTGGVAQRLPKKPDFDGAEKWRLQNFVSEKPGTCCAMARHVFNALDGTVEKRGRDRRVVHISWVEGWNTEHMMVRNHTAAMFKWDEGEFVVDTTASQFGGPPILVCSFPLWFSTITDLLKKTRRINHETWDFEKLPLADSDMAMLANDRQKELAKQNKPVKGAAADSKHSKDAKGKDGSAAGTAAALPASAAAAASTAAKPAGATSS